MKEINCNSCLNYKPTATKLTSSIVAGLQIWCFEDFKQGTKYYYIGKEDEIFTPSGDTDSFYYAYYVFETGDGELYYNYGMDRN